MPVAYLKESPSQTGGPYVHIGTLPPVAGLARRTQERLDVLNAGPVAGERIRIEGLVLDGSGHPVRDALIELWQADSAGEFGGRDFTGWGRAAADFQTGEWSFETIKPGRAAWRDGRLQAPHVSLMIFARGINIGLHTRMYFADEAAANAEDPVLRAIELGETRRTLIAERTVRDGVAVYRFEIRLQGAGETVFFDC